MKQLLKKAKYISIFVLVLSYLGCEKVENVFPKITSGFTYTATDKGNVTFINTSEEAQSYLWDFGDGESSTEINPVKSYAASGTYKVTLKASNNAGASDTSEAQLSIEIAAPAETCTEETAQSLDAADFNLTFQTDPESAIVSDGAAYSYIDNPDFDNSVNPSCKVAEIVRDASLPFANNQILFDSKFDFTANAGFKLKVWAPAVGTNVLLKLEDKSDSNINTEAGAVTTVANAWEELTFDFPDTESGKYDKIVLFLDISTDSGATYYLDDFALYGTGGGSNCTAETSQSLAGADLNITFQTDPGSAIVGDGATYSYIDNPDPSGINTSCKIGEIVRDPSLPFANNQIEVDSKFDFTANSGFKLKVWAPAVGTNVLLKLEDKTDNTINTEAGAVTTTANAWEELTFDFPGTESGKYDKIVLFFDINTNSGETYYIDDFALYGDGSGGGGCTDTALELPIDFDCSTITYDFVTFNGASYSVVDNPDLSGVNNVASKVGEIVNIGGAFEGGAFTLDTPVDFSTDKAITMKFYSTVGVDILLKFEGAGAPVETTATHGGTGWEQLTFTFTTSDQFTTLVLFVDGPGTTAGTFYMDDIEQVPAGGGGCTDTALELPIDFDCSTITYDFATFNGASYSVVDNPDLSGVNNVASKVGEIVNIGGAFEGGAFTLDTPVDFSTDKAITMKFYSTVGVDILLKFEGAGAPVETTATHGGTGWEQLTFDFTTSDQFGTLVLFVDGPGTTAGTFYMDDIEQVPAGGGGGTGGNLAANGDFETGDDTGWLLFQNGGTSALDNTINNGGTWSGKLATSGPSNPAFKQERIGAGSVNAGDTIQVQFDHIGSVVQPGAVFNVILFGEGAAGASFTNVFNPAPSLTGSWTTFTGTFAIPGGTDVSEGISFLIEAVCGGDAGCSVSANIDNVSVTVL